MAEILYNFDDVHFAVAVCDECGSFTSAVYKFNDDIEFLYTEAADHLKTEHGTVAER